MELDFFANLGEKTYKKFEDMNYEHDKKIRPWLELQSFERDIWNKLCVNLVERLTAHYEENYDPEEPEMQINEAVSFAIKEKNNEITIKE